MSQLNFDASQVAPNTGSPDPVPAAWYNAMIDESEMKPTKDGMGDYLELRFNIIDGMYAGRKVYERLNMRNSNATAQEIGHGTLSAICYATGVMQVQDSQQLHGQPMKIKVKLKPAKGDYDASNEITSYKNINEQVGTPGATPQSQAPAQAVASPVQPVQPQVQQPPQGWAPQPQVQQPAPVVQQPVVQQPAPVVQQPAPVVQQAAPVVQQPAPVAQEPVVQAAPVDNGAPPPWVAQQQQQQ